jgi:hypothetical protein
VVGVVGGGVRAKPREDAEKMAVDLLGVSINIEGTSL